MPRGVPIHANRRVPLPKALQARFDAFVARVGGTRAAHVLGVGDSTIDRLLHGGSAAPEAVARVAVKLEELHDHA